MPKSSFSTSIFFRVLVALGFLRALGSEPRKVRPSYDHNLPLVTTKITTRSSAPLRFFTTLLIGSWGGKKEKVAAVDTALNWNAGLKKQGLNACYVSHMYLDTCIYINYSIRKNEKVKRWGSSHVSSSRWQVRNRQSQISPRSKPILRILCSQARLWCSWCSGMLDAAGCTHPMVS